MIPSWRLVAIAILVIICLQHKRSSSRRLEKTKKSLSSKSKYNLFRERGVCLKVGGGKGGGGRTAKRKSLFFLDSERTRHPRHASILKNMMISKRRKKTFEDNYYLDYLYFYSLALKIGGLQPQPLTLRGPYYQMNMMNNRRSGRSRDGRRKCMPKRHHEWQNELTGFKLL